LPKTRNSCANTVHRSWGQRGGNSFSPPQTATQVGANCDWVEAFVANNHCVGLRDDGSIWEWGHLAGGRGQFVAVPTQVGQDRDWTAIAAGDVHTVALKRDGTLWSWGDNSMLQLGNGPGPSQATPVQVGTNHGWMAVTCGQGSQTFALQTDGTLWVWGAIPGFADGKPGVALPTPVRVCRDTNWTGLVAGPTAWALTPSGVWDLLQAPPNALSERSAVCRFISTNSQPQKIALAFCGRPEIYRVSSDGRLWMKLFPIGPRAGTRSRDWRQVGNRTDWTMVCGAGTALGCTRDGTLWMWGTDPSQEPILDLRSRYRLLEDRVLTWFGIGGGGVSTSATWPYQKEPRPVLKWTVSSS
jgi:alpha-tubulin suppressor-like RCC1 family protein